MLFSFMTKTLPKSAGEEKDVSYRKLVLTNCNCYGYH